MTSTSTDPAAGRIRSGLMLFLAASALSFLLSVGLWFTGQKETGLFVGLWVPSILALGAFVFAARRVR